MIRCNNYEWPDLFGHYRESKFTQIKHHWWWKAIRVFDELEVTKHYSGYYNSGFNNDILSPIISSSGSVIFLEEDHFVAEDLLHLLKLMKKKSREVCSACNILSLGSYLPYDDYSDKSNKVRGCEDGGCIHYNVGTNPLTNHKSMNLLNYMIK